MKTHRYNPSQLELDFAEAIQQATKHLQATLPNYHIAAVDVIRESDNPMLLYKVLW